MALADDFLIAERPVILIDLEFDSAPIYLWTRPFTGEFGGKTYQPIAGITGALSVRQSLDRPTLNATAQINGSSGEIEAAALTEEFQGRPAQIALGNLDAGGNLTNVEVQLPGTMQDIPLAQSGDQSTAAVQIESVFAEIDRARDLRYSKADQARFDPNDSFFDFVATASVNTPRFGG